MNTLDCSDNLGRSNNLNLIRIVAALSVILGHSFALVYTNGTDPIAKLTFGYTYSGSIAVSAFFALSGFLVTRSYYLNPSIVEWLGHRAARIYPGAIVCVGIVVLYSYFSSGLRPGFFTSAGVTNFIQTNVVLRNFAPDIGQVVFPNNRQTDSLVGSWWTLPGELRVYLLFATLALLGLIPHRTAKRLQFRIFISLASIIALLVWSFVGHAGMPIILDHPSYASPTRYFLLGVLCFLLRRYIPLDWRILVVLLVVPFFSAHSKAGFLLLLSLPTTYSVFYFGYGVRDLGFERFIGDWSYGIYIYGWFAQQVVASFQPDQSPTSNFFFASILSITLGGLSWRLVEKPSLSIARRLTSNWVPVRRLTR